MKPKTSKQAKLKKSLKNLPNKGKISKKQAGEDQAKIADFIAKHSRRSGR